MVNLFKPKNLKQKEHEKLNLDNIKYKYTYKRNYKENSVILFCKTKYYRFAIYWYKDDKDSCYLSNVYVEYKYRKLGIGNILLKHALQIAKNYRFKTIYLKCSLFSWVFKWYERNGFDFHSFVDDNRNKKWIWLYKNIILD